MGASTRDDGAAREQGARETRGAHPVNAAPAPSAHEHAPSAHEHAASPQASEIARRPGRSHPPSLMRLAERVIRDEELIARGDVVLCACSGGPDSTALLHVLGRLRERFHFSLVAHGVDHGLRMEAAAELGVAGRVAASLGVPFAITRVDVAPGGNLQARAREARFGALRTAARLAGARRIATGHTADDRAETVLLRLLRGAGPEGLAVLPPSAPFPESVGTATSTLHPTSTSIATSALHPAITSYAPSALRPETPGASRRHPEIALIRPLIFARRVDVAAHLGRHHIAAAHDPSNADARFLRVRVRSELLPLMEDMSPAIVEHLCALADMLAATPAADAPLRGLGRAQRLAVARAKKCEREVKLRLSGGRDVVVGFSGDEVVLIGEPPDARPLPPK